MNTGRQINLTDQVFGLTRHVRLTAICLSGISTLAIGLWVFVGLRSEIGNQISGQVTRIVEQANNETELMGLQSRLSGLNIPFDNILPTHIEVLITDSGRLIATHGKAHNNRWGAIQTQMSLPNSFFGHLSIKATTNFRYLTTLYSLCVYKKICLSH